MDQSRVRVIRLEMKGILENGPKEYIAGSTGEAWFFTWELRLHTSLQQSQNLSQYLLASNNSQIPRRIYGTNKVQSRSSFIPLPCPHPFPLPFRPIRRSCLQELHRRRFPRLVRQIGETCRRLPRMDRWQDLRPRRFSK